MEFQSCNSSSDCEIDLNNGETLQKFCYERLQGIDQSHICDCANTPGFHGLTCDISSVQSIWLGTVSVTTLLISLYGALFALQVLFRNQKTIRDTTSVPLTRTLLGALILTALGHISHGIRMIFFLLWIKNPDKTVIVTEKVFFEEVEDAAGPGGQVAFHFSNIGYILLGLSTICVLFSWLMVLEKAVIHFDSGIYIKIHRFKRRTIVFAVISSISTLSFLFAHLSIAGRIFLGIGGIGVILIAVYARYWFVSCVTEFMGTADRKGKVALVSYYSKIHISVLLLLLFFTLADTLLSFLLTIDLPPGSFLFNNFFFDLNFVLIGILLLVTTNFIQELFKRQHSHNSKLRVMSIPN